MRSKLLCASLLAVGAAGGWLAAAIAQPAEQPPRFHQLTLEELTPAQRPLGEEIMKISSVGIGGPYNLLLRSPVLGQKVFDQMDYLRWHSSVPLRLNEFAILMIGRQWRSQVEWAAHAPLAEKAGLSLATIAQLKAGKRPTGMAEDEAVVYDFLNELTITKQVSGATFARAQKAFTEQQIVDLTAVSGSYVMLAMQMAMSNQGLPPGREPAFKVGEP